MLPRPVDLVGEQRAAGTALLPIGTEHEVVDHELAASVEQAGERHRTVGVLEDIVLLDPDPGQRAALFRQAVALAGIRLLLGEKGAAGLEPLFLRDDLVLGHEYLLSVTEKCRCSLSSAPFQPSSWLRPEASSRRPRLGNLRSVPSADARKSIS